MDKTLHHRMTRWMRLALSGSLVFHSLFGLWGVEPLFAQNPDVMFIGVTPISLAAPAVIADLLASPNLAAVGQISLTWMSPQGNAGGYPVPNQAVAAYVIHYATFSIASLSGDTTSWWNATSANSVMLQAPDYIPKTPGQLEADVISGLIPGTRYYFSAKSISQGGITSPIDGLSSTPGQQANAVASIILNATGTPHRPNGFTLSAGGGQFTLKWHPVTLDLNNQAIAVDHYLLYRYNTIGSSPTVSATIMPSGAPSYTDTIGGNTYFYRVFAVAAGGATSAASDYLDSSAQENHYAIASDDIDTRVVLPDVLAQELNSEHNVYGEDLEIRLDRRQQDEVDVTLRSYHVGVFKALSNQEVPYYTFTQAGMQVQLGLGAILGSGQLNPNQTQQLRQMSGTSAGSIAQIVSVYWFNGSNYLRISDPVLTSAQSLSVSVRNVGVYQVRATQISTVFKLTQGSPYPRVITPNDPSQNNRVFWFFDNPTDEAVTGTIFDIRGAKVRELSVNSQSPTSNSLVWDGHDFNGAVVRSGVYLYRISAGKDTQTGTVVVAR